MNNIKPHGNKGKHRTKEHNEKISKSLMGRHLQESTKEKIRLSQLGKSKSNKHKKNIALNHADFSGKNHPGYKNPEDRITPIYRAIRTSDKYKDWEHSVKLTFNFTCQYCQVRGGNLVSHHIKKFADIIKENDIKTLEESSECVELWDINNGITYCKKCHDSLKNMGGLL